MTYRFKTYRAGETRNGTQVHAMQPVDMGGTTVWMSLCGVDADEQRSARRGLQEFKGEARNACQRCARLRQAEKA